MKVFVFDMFCIQHLEVAHVCLDGLAVVGVIVI